MENRYLEMEFTIASHEVDLWGRLKPVALLNMCQEAAYVHSTQMGFGYDAFIEFKMAWVLSRLCAKIERMPRWREKIVVRTWHKRQSKLFSLRDYSLFDEEGREIISVTTSWLIISLESRRMVRLERFLEGRNDIIFAPYDLDAVEGEASKVELPSAMEAVRRHRISYSDLDLNTHANNARYMEWVVDSVDYQMDRKKQLKSFTINYNSEAKWSQELELQRSVSGGEVLVGGVCEGRSVFAACLTYQELSDL